MEKNWQKTPYSKADIESWYDRHPDVLGIGLLLGHQGVIAIDLDGYGAIEKIKQLTGKSTLEEIFGHTVAVTSGIPYRCQFFYRVPSGLFEDLTCSTISTNRKTYIKPDHKIKTDQIEFRYRGHQSVLDGNHPITGVYRCLPGHSFADFDEIPQLPPLLIAMISNRKDIKDVLTLLPHIDSEDYIKWRDTGIALKGLSIQWNLDLFQEWLEWSKKASNYKDEGECRKKWDSFPDNPNFDPIAKIKYLAGATSANRADKDPPKTTKQRILDVLTQDLPESDEITALTDIKNSSAYNLDKDFNRLVDALRKEKKTQTTQTTQSRKYKLEAIDVDDPSFQEDVEGEEDYLVDSLLERGKLYMLSAPPKTGKSVLSTNLAYCITTGKTFCHLKCKQGKVLYISIDELIRDTNRKFKLLGLYDQPKEIRKKLKLCYKFPQKMSESDLLEALNVLLEDSKPDIVLLDSWAMLTQIANIDENKREAGDFAGKLRKLISVKHKATAVMIFHNSKGDKNGFTSYNARGHSSVEAAVDGILILSENPSRDKKYRKLQTRARIASPDLELIFNDEMQWSELGAFSLVSNNKIQKATTDQEKIYNLICANYGLTRKDIAERLKINANSVSSYLTKLKKDGKIIDKKVDKKIYWVNKSDPVNMQKEWDGEQQLAYELEQELKEEKL